MRGNKFNLLGALNGETRKAQAGEKVKPREVNMDPNRLSWPYLKVSELKKDVAKEALRRAGAKLPVRTKFISRD